MVFLVGETSQYEPTLIKNTTFVAVPKTPEEGYHLTDDLADNAIQWIHDQKAIDPKKPFFMYWGTRSCPWGTSGKQQMG